MTDEVRTLQSHATPIPGLTVWDLPVHGDNRGWFKENWQREKMMAAGLPDFRPVQNNVSFNAAVGTTRGIHAEPWDKFVSVASGRVFAAWVDLRDGPNFGATFTVELDPSTAVFVPRGVGNAFQTLEANTAYVYLVNDHYSAEGNYVSVNVADETIAIDWPVPLERAELSAKDQANSLLRDIVPIDARKTLVVGGTGQLGRALRAEYTGCAGVEFVDRTDFDLTDTAIESSRNWAEYDTVINAAAYTNVDAAETSEGRSLAWRVNVAGVASLARICSKYNLTLVHISSDYVFDGTASRPYRESDPMSPISVYGQTKAAGDHIVATVPRHYLLRTSWVIGEGRNFVQTMVSLAAQGVAPLVVNDQFGQLTFASDLARAVRFLREIHADYGTYNVTSDGSATSWADLAQDVFTLADADARRVHPVSSAEYSASKGSQLALRPQNSVLDMSKIKAIGFSCISSDISLSNYVQYELSRDKAGRTPTQQR